MRSPCYRREVVSREVGRRSIYCYRFRLVCGHVVSRLTTKAGYAPRFLWCRKCVLRFRYDSGPKRAWIRSLKAVKSLVVDQYR